MTKTIRISTIVLVSLGAAWFGLPGCNGANEPSRQSPMRVMSGVAGSSLMGIAGAYTDYEDWEKKFLLCGVTRAGKQIAKNIPCTPDDVQQCYKKCGPYNIGYKELNCEGAAYAENSMCNFWPRGNFSCFKIPEPEDVDERCPRLEVNAPRHGFDCDLEECVVCGGNSNEQTTGYRDQTAGQLKVGFCVCRPGVDSDGSPTKKWACATMGTAWPCPNGFGC